ncbi:MAG: YhgE/Pip domain-containing protein [Micrococcales bacterium]|nr:YhgE/Pip domain-containing protein [Micrococcales bacterium]
MTRLSRGIFGKLIVIALITVPSIYAGLLTWSNLHATTSLDRVPAAIVNLDEAATVTDTNGKKQTVPLGRVVTGQLVGNDSTSNLDWSLTDAQGAKAGLEDGSYYAVLTIPASFSKAATSSVDADTARQATMRLETNDATSYLAGNIASAVSAKITTSTGDELTRGYLDRIYLGFNSLHTNMIKAKDGATGLSGGLGKLRTGSAALDDGTHQLVVGLDQLAGGTGQLASGADKLSGGATSLAGGAGQLADGNAQLATGLGTLRDKTTQFPAQTKQLADGARGLDTGAQRLATGATQLATGLDQARQLTAALPGQASALAAGSKQLVDSLGSLGTAATGLAEGAAGVADGGAKLADGASTLADGATALRTGTRTTADAAEQLRTGATRAAGGVEDHTRAVSELAGQCAASGAADAFCRQLSTVAAGGGTLREGTTGVADGARSLAGGAEQLADGASQLASGAAPLRTGAAGLAAGAARLDSGAGQFAAGATKLSSGGDALGTGLAALASGAPKLVDGVGKAADAADQLATGASALSAGSKQLTTGLTALAAAAPQLTGGIAQAATAASQLSVGATELRSGAEALADGAGQTAAGTHKLDDGAQSAAAGAAKLGDGMGRLRAGITKADNGAKSLADGLTQGAKQIPTYDKDQRNRLASVVAEPVGADGVRLHRVAAYGYGLAPYFIALGLWVGGMSLFFMLRPIPTRAVASTAPSWRVALAGLAPAALFGVAQALVLSAIVMWWIGVQVASPLLFVAFALLTSLTFVAINQALVAALGPAGRFIGLILIVLQLSAAGATYPIETTPGFFQTLHPLLPLTYAVRAFRSLIAGGSLYLAPSAVVLACWFVASLLVTVFIARRQRAWSVARLRPARVG